MSILEKIKNVIHNLFYPQKRLAEGKNEKESMTLIDNSFKSLQKDTKDYQNKKELLDMISKNPSLIDSLSYERLVQLNAIYDEKIAELKLELEMKKNS